MFFDFACRLFYYRSQQRHPSDGNEKYQGVLLTRGVPQIHFGREDGVECTLLRVACQGETFLAPPWQGSIDIRVLWHIGCQSDFDELVSMSSRPVDRGSGRMGSISTTFHPVKGGFARMGSISTTFHPAKGGFARTRTRIWPKICYI